MNWETVLGNWTQLRGRIRMQWGKLTDDQLDVIEGRRDLLLGQAAGSVRRHRTKKPTSR